VFCPNDVRMPKSYLSIEPGCQRAEANGFDPYLQTFQRLRAFRAIGHATDKVELIVLGGTFSYYPENYRRWFIKRCFDALNDFGSGQDDCAEAEGQRLSLAEQRTQVDGRALTDGNDRAYNRVRASCSAATSVRAGQSSPPLTATTSARARATWASCSRRGRTTSTTRR
jgi:elongator complex protein 3